MTTQLILISALRLHEGRAQHPAGNFHHVKNLLRVLVPKIMANGLGVSVLVDELGYRDLVDVIPRSVFLVEGKHGDSVFKTDMRIRSAIRRLSPALFFRPAGQLPFGFIGCPAIMGVADLNFRWLPTSLAKRIYKEISYWWGFNLADRITCISEFTRDDVISKFSVPASRIKAIHLAASQMQPEKPIQGLADGFWLTFGHQAHKNVELCLLALKRRKCDTLVVVGLNSHIDKVLKPMVVQLGLVDRVIFIGQISNAELSWLYKRARGLLFVSLFEGFGLPLLEAMQSGCSVITSRVCSLPEIAGDAALYVSTDSDIELAEAMGRIMEDEELSMRLIESGYRRASLFSWEAAAEKTFNLLIDVLDESNDNFVCV